MPPLPITIEMSPDIELQIREQAARGNADVVRHLLAEALDPTVEALIRHHASVKLSPDEFEALADQLADEFMGYVGPDCPPLSDFAISREGLYEDRL